MNEAWRVEDGRGRPWCCNRCGTALGLREIRNFPRGRMPILCPDCVLTTEVEETEEVTTGEVIAIPVLLLRSWAQALEARHRVHAGTGIEDGVLNEMRSLLASLPIVRSPAQSLD